jgi:hypothetical protein
MLASGQCRFDAHGCKPADALSAKSSRCCTRIYGSLGGEDQNLATVRIGIGMFGDAHKAQDARREHRLS